MDLTAEFVKSWVKLSKDWNTRLENELAPKLTSGQLEVLELLQSHGSMKPSDMLPFLETTPAAITTLIDRMERAGLVVRKRDKGDRRTVWVSPTKFGEEEYKRGIWVREKIVTGTLDRISTHNKSLFIFLLSKVAGTMVSKN